MVYEATGHYQRFSQQSNFVAEQSLNTAGSHMALSASGTQ